METIFNSAYGHAHLLDRFLRYVQVDTQSDPASDSFPSTEKQRHLSEMLAGELQQMGYEAEVDAHGYVFGTIPATVAHDVPVVCFCSHVDTTSDCSGTGVKPLVHPSFDGNPIVLPDDSSQVISKEDFPYLEQKIGDDIVTASGTTLLGADDKAGVAIIMELARYLKAHPETPHGRIRLLFTPDEETGRGTERLDMQRLAADIGYTLDGGEAGDMEDETFSADGATVTIHGVGAHPGAAKGILVNALKVAASFLEAVDQQGWSPETTDGRQGFVHPVQVKGLAEKAVIDFLIRDFDTDNLKVFAAKLQALLEETLQKHPGATGELVVREQYRNMNEVLRDFPQITALAEQAIHAAGLTVRKTPIRGGTDGSKLSFMGLPCPNLFTGMQAIHSKREWVSVQDMYKSLEVLVRLVQLWAKPST